MPQAGIHGLVGMLTKKVSAKREWLLLGTILGSFVPDMDNVGVAVATLAGWPTAGIHRSLTHSVFFIAAVIAVFYLIANLKKDAKWGTLGLGLGLGILLHVLLDLVIWFNGAYIFWPIPVWVNLWENVHPPEWLHTFLGPAEFLAFALYLWALGKWAAKFGTDQDFETKRKRWMWLEIILFAIFLPLAYIMTKGFLTIFGALYLFSLFVAFFVTIRMRKTISAA